LIGHWAASWRSWRWKLSRRRCAVQSTPQDDNGAYQILGRGFNPNGTQRKADFTVNSDSSGQQVAPAVAIDEQDRFVFGWQDDMDGDDNPLILMRNVKF
jgi:hypothetical protein